MEALNYQSALLIPILGILAGIIIPISVFIWLYKDAKNKQKTILEISKNLDDPSKVEELLKIFEERKKSQLISEEMELLLYLQVLALFFWSILLGYIMKAVGALISLIGLGTLIAGYLYPNTGKELTNAVEEFEKK